MARAITVYCSSSSTVAPVYDEAGRDLGRAIAREGWTLVYGGNCIGVMKALSDGAREMGGKVVGITPQLLVDKGIADTNCELITTKDMRQRKALMEERGDAFVAFPGGLGTFEEIFEIIVGRVLGCHAKPIVILNIAGYYDPLLTMIDHGIGQNFIKPKARNAWTVASSVDEAVGRLRDSLSGSQETRRRGELS